MKTNIQLYQDIMDKLEFEPSLDIANLTVAIHDGTVTLRGTIKNYLDKWRIIQAIKSITGVKAIADEIQVNISSSFQRSDTEIAEAALNAINWNISIPKDSIQVVVEKGIVTLTGEVDWQFQKQSAETTVQKLIGIKGINNLIIIRPGVKPSDVKEKIIKEFERNALVDAKNIQVNVNGNEVILQGNVRSWAEFDEAAKAAWSVPGVIVVDNRLHINY